MKIKYFVHRAGETWDKLISQPMRMTPLSPSYPWCPKSPAQAQINPGLSLCRLCTGRNQHSEIAEFFFLVYLYSSWISTASLSTKYFLLKFRDTAHPFLLVAFPHVSSCVLITCAIFIYHEQIVSD